MEHIHVHIGYDIAAEPLQLLRQAVADNVLLTTGETAPEEAEIIVHGRPPRQMLAGPLVRALINPWAGVSATIRAMVKDELPHIAVHNLHHNAVPVAETVWMLLLAAAKLTVPFDQALRAEDWRPRYSAGQTTRLLAGKTMLILGFGAIGREVARRCAAFDIEVLAIRRRSAQGRDPFAAQIYSPDQLPALLPRAELICITLPLTPQTAGMIGPQELALLPPRAILINIGRGEIVDEAALYAALQDGRLHAAGLDVWYNYPADVPGRTGTPPANFPFHTLDNVVMSPHRGGMTDGTEALRMAHLARLLNAAARGETMPNRVDLQRGY